MANDKENETVKSETLPDRRKLFRRLAALAGLGVTGFLLSQQLPGNVRAQTSVGPANAAGDAVAMGDDNVISGTSNRTGLFADVPGDGTAGDGTAYGLLVSNTGATSTNQGGAILGGIEGVAPSTDNTTLAAIQGLADVGVGVFGYSSSTAGVFGYSQNGVGGYFQGTPAIYADGNVGIGTTAPARSLHLQSDNAVFRMDRDVDSSAFILVRTAAGNFSTIWKTFYVGVNASGVNNGEFFIGDVGSNVSGASTIRLLIDNNGNVGIGSIANTQTSFSNILTLPNTASTAGRGLANAWSTYSSIRWKMNVQPIQDAIGLIQRLRGVRFNWKTGGKEDIGLIAEEVGQVVPEIVTYEPNGHDAQSLDYSRLIPVTIQAIKEQQKIIEQLNGKLEAENKSLREENKGLSERLEAVERKLGLEN